VPVLQVGGVVLGAAGVRVAVREEQRPAVGGGGAYQLVQALSLAGVVGDVVDPRVEPGVLVPVLRRRLLDEEVDVALGMRARGLAELGQLPSQLAEQPAPGSLGCGQIRYPQLDVVQRAHAHLLAPPGRQSTSPPGLAVRLRMNSRSERRLRYLIASR